MKLKRILVLVGWFLLALAGMIIFAMHLNEKDLWCWVGLVLMLIGVVGMLIWAFRPSDEEPLLTNRTGFGKFNPRP